MKELFGHRLVRAVLAVIGLLPTVGGPVPTAAVPVLRTFQSNGCSVFPDGDTYGCCYMHDVAYFAGGTAADRRSADRALELCVADVTGNHAIGGVMYVAVSLFGLPGVPTRVHWGYGWDDTRQISYAPLTPGEQDQLNARKQEACRALTHDAATGHYMIDAVHWLREVDGRQICAIGPAAPNRR